MRPPVQEAFNHGWKGKPHGQVLMEQETFFRCRRRISPIRRWCRTRRRKTPAGRQAGGETEKAENTRIVSRPAVALLSAATLRGAKGSAGTTAVIPYRLSRYHGGNPVQAQPVPRR